MTGYFWKTRDANTFGAFTPSLGTGLYHVADEKISPGMKLWSYGVGEDKAWATVSTGQRKPYAEIQGGPIGDQSIKLELQPGQTRSHVEYWIPTDKPLDIYSLKVPRRFIYEQNRPFPFFNGQERMKSLSGMNCSEPLRRKVSLQNHQWLKNSCGHLQEWKN